MRAWRWGSVQREKSKYVPSMQGCDELFEYGQFDWWRLSMVYLLNYINWPFLLCLLENFTFWAWYLIIHRMMCLIRDSSLSSVLYVHMCVRVHYDGTVWYCFPVPPNASRWPWPWPRNPKLQCTTLYRLITTFPFVNWGHSISTFAVSMTVQEFTALCLHSCVALSTIKIEPQYVMCRWRIYSALNFRTQPDVWRRKMVAMKQTITCIPWIINTLKICRLQIVD